MTFSFSPHLSGSLQNNLETNGYKITNNASAKLTMQYLLGTSPTAEINIGGNTSRQTISLLAEDNSGNIADGITITGGGAGNFARRVAVDNLPVVFANLSSTERGQLQTTAGMVIWNTTNQKLEVYTGFTWVALH